MTIGDLQEQIKRALSAGTVTEEDTVFIRDATVSDSAMSAGSNGYVDADEVLVIPGDSVLAPGIYFMLEVFD